jgi:hypothetical protein
MKQSVNGKCLVEAVGWVLRLQHQPQASSKTSTTASSLQQFQQCPCCLTVVASVREKSFSSVSSDPHSEIPVSPPRHGLPHTRAICEAAGVCFVASPCTLEFCLQEVAWRWGWRTCIAEVSIRTPSLWENGWHILPTTRILEHLSSLCCCLGETQKNRRIWMIDSSLQSVYGWKSVVLLGRSQWCPLSAVCCTCVADLHTLWRHASTASCDVGGTHLWWASLQISPAQAPARCAPPQASQCCAPWMNSGWNNHVRRHEGWFPSWEIRSPVLCWKQTEWFRYVQEEDLVHRETKMWACYIDSLVSYLAFTLQTDRVLVSVHLLANWRLSRKNDQGRWSGKNAHTLVIPTVVKVTTRLRKR